SPAMVRLGLEELAWTLEPEMLRRKLDCELPGWDGLGACRWEPLGVVLHVLAGNVFVGAAGSLVEGLLTRNVNILKMSSSEGAFLPLLLESLREEDRDGIVSRCLFAVSFPSEDEGVAAEFKRNADAVAVWGGEGAVRGWREGLPARTRLIVFGPKISAAVVTVRGLREEGLEKTASGLAAEASIWDQNACTAPQVCYVQGAENARRLVEALPKALGREARRLPPGLPGTDAAIEIHKLRDIFEIAETRGEGLLRRPRGLAWTVVLDKDPALNPSPLHRTLRVVPVSRLEPVLREMEALRGYVQTVGLAASAAEREALADRFSQAGAVRVVALGRMAYGEGEDPHDGARDLPQFMRLVLRRFPRPAWTPFEGLTPGNGKGLIESRLRRLIELSRRSPFYGRRLKGLGVERVSDLRKIPILTRAEMEANMPPQGEGLSTGPWRGGYVTRSGGSTGAPKFSVYDGPDWERMIAHAADVFRSLGLSASDRLGNLMMAGDLYGSFVSFDHVNCRLGAASFAFAGSSTPETFADIWRKFRLNAVEGIPSTLIPFLRRAKALEPRLRLEKVLYAGSPLGAEDREWLKKSLRARRVASLIGANDGGQIGYQCERLRGSLHHTVDDFNLLELVDERGRPAREGEPGRILITSLLKFAYPLLRYDIGDIGRIVSARCACGRPSRVFELLGRSDDGLTVGMMNIRHRDFAAALKGLPVSALQLAVCSEKGGESISLRVETPFPSPALRERVRSAVLRSAAKVGERLKEGALKDLRVELHRPGALPRNPRTGKLKSPIDERS
ncbi:MAG: acyl-CoA reductase, partial [Elusimicrobiota bacterium]